MSDAAAAPDASPPSRSGRLLGLVRLLIDYGKGLADALRQRVVSSDSTALFCAFGTGDLGLILARVTQGLRRAQLLEEKIVHAAKRIDAEPRPKSAPTPPTRPSSTRAPSPLDTEAQSTGTDPRLALLPTPEQIAAKIRRQPIGAVLADICRDLGIGESHPLWRELFDVINEYGGNCFRLAMDRIRQTFPTAHLRASRKAKAAAAPAPSGTGPPLAIPA